MVTHKLKTIFIGEVKVKVVGGKFVLRNPDGTNKKLVFLHQKSIL